MNLIPAIDLRAGRVVRLRQGDFARSRSFDIDPQALARRYAEAGAERLHVVDLDGARAGRPRHLDALGELAATGLRVQWGGGLRERTEVDRALAAGADRVLIGSVAVTDPDRFCTWLDELGPEKLVLALDLRCSGFRWRPAIDAWQRGCDVDVEALVDRCAGAGLRHVLSTDIGCDGMAAGPSVALYRWACARWPGLEWIASGGIRDARDLGTLARLGVSGCVVGSALLDGSLPLSVLAAA